MSGSRSEINAVDQILQKVDLAGIQDERARECIRLLLNLIESLTAELRKAHAENLCFTHWICLKLLHPYTRAQRRERLTAESAPPSFEPEFTCETATWANPATT